MKVCTTCREPKELSEFHKMSRCLDGLKPRCKLCEKAYKDEYRKLLTERGLCISCGQRPHNQLTTFCNECSNIGKRRSHNRQKVCRENGTCITCQNTPARSNHRTCAKCSSLVSRLGSAKALNISLEEYDNWMKDAFCLVCGSKEDLNLDHDHKTGKIRGVLCGSDNRALGLLKDNSERIRALADYNDSHNLTQ